MTTGENEMRVAVMGATGSGKSTFINIASGSNFAVSDSLESCTIDVETATFSLDGRAVTLIDTPGFDDTTRSDTDVLKSITDYLSSSYSQGARLAGLIYMHRITDNKMGGPSRKNFHIFRNLCGDASLKNVLLVTNMWSKVDPADGEARERELASKDKFFKPALDKGARMLRHDGSQTSSHAILRQLFDRKHATLLVEDEMVNQGKDLAHTTVGANVMRDLREQAERHAEALDDLCLGIEAARMAEDEETREILQEEARKARERIERIRGDLERMVTNFAAENARLEDENRRYRKDFRNQRTDAEQMDRLFEQERRAREHAEAEKRKAEARLAAELDERERDEQKSGPEVREKQGVQGQESQERDKGREQEREREREREEYRKREQALIEAAEHAKSEQERMRKELERLEKEKNSSYGCLIQ